MKNVGWVDPRTLIQLQGLLLDRESGEVSASEDSGKLSESLAKATWCTDVEGKRQSLKLSTRGTR